MTDDYMSIEDSLLAVLAEIRGQPNVGKDFPPGQISFVDEVELIRGWIEDHREYGVAYEAIITILEASAFQISSRAAVNYWRWGCSCGSRPSGSKMRVSIVDRFAVTLIAQGFLAGPLGPTST
jgi:hypothetical protein